MNQLTKRQKIICSIYFILGVPALPLAVVMVLMRRYLAGDTQYFNPENRVNFIVEFCAYMIAFTLFGGLICLLLHFVKP
jgi:hypothetical protein